MKHLLILWALLLVLSNAIAQQTMSLKDATLGAGTYLRPASPEQLKWRDSEHYVLVKENKLIQFTVKNNNPEEILSLTDLNTLATPG